MTKAEPLNITLRQLRTLLTPVLPMASTDAMIPVLNAVHIKSHGRWLVATSTDRFRVGMKRIERFDEDGDPAPWPTFEALVPVVALRSILKTFAGKPRDPDPELTITVADTLRVEMSGAWFTEFASADITYPIQDGEFPKVASIITKALEAATEPAETTRFNAAFMADYRHAGSTLTMRRGKDPRDPLLITDGEDFISVLMPRNALGESAPAEPWDDILAGKTVKVVAKKKAA